MTMEGDAGFVCDECNHEAPSEQGLKAHKTRSHKKTAPVTADEAFDRIGAATEALFPAGIPASRVIEIAELQKAMLKVVTRL